MSMYDTPEYIRRALKVGENCYVLKNACAAELERALRAAAAGIE